MTTKIMTEGSLREAKEQLEEVKAQIEVGYTPLLEYSLFLWKVAHMRS